jgi:hypothetical protein
VSRRPVPMRPQLVRCRSGPSSEGDRSHRLLVGRRLGNHWAVSIEVVGFGCNPWRWYKGMREVHMSKGRVGEDRGSKETDGCPLTLPPSKVWCHDT